MGIREGTRAIFVNASEAAWGAIDPPSLEVASELAGEFDYIHLFTKTQAELDDTFPKLNAHLYWYGNVSSDIDCKCEYDL